MTGGERQFLWILGMIMVVSISGMAISTWGEVNKCECVCEEKQ